MKTTLNQIKYYCPRTFDWHKLLRYFGKTEADDEELSLLTVLDSNDLHDALRCLKIVKGFEKEKRMFAVFCARQVQHLMADQRSIDTLGIAEKFCAGKATDEEFRSAYEAAKAAYATAAEAAVIKTVSATGAKAAYQAARAAFAALIADATDAAFAALIADATCAEKDSRKGMTNILTAELRRVLTECGG